MTQLFRKPSIRITAAGGGKSRAPVELRALTTQPEDCARSAEETLDSWRLMDEKTRRAAEGERKKRLAQQKDNQSRRMTVDGRLIQVGLENL